MTANQLGANALLDLVAESLKGEIAAALPADKRYLVAMLANAVDIARREMAGEAEAAQFALLDRVYDDGDGTMRRLAADIRSGKVGDAGFPDLRRRLRAQVVAELEVRNPRFLKALAGKR
jgi:hypothetical protein